MPISVSSKPDLFAWSHVYAQYGFAYSGMTPGWKLQVQFVDPLDSWKVLAEVQYPFTATSGNIFINDAQKLIEKSLVWGSYSNTFVNTISPYELIGKNRTISIRYRAITTGVSPDWIYHDYYPIWCKGGYSSLDTVKELRINKYTPAGGTLGPLFYPNGSKFLTMVPTGRTMRPDEYGWLLYQASDGSVAGSPSQSARYTVRYLNGTTATFTRPIYIDLTVSGDYWGRVFMIPIGVKQAALDPSNLGVESVQIDIVLSTGGVTASYKTLVDNRPYYKNLTLLYRNSMGGIDNISLNGIVQVAGATVEKNEYHQHRVYGAGILDGEEPYYRSKARPTFKGNTGYLSLQHKIALLDLFNTDGAWIWLNNNAYPVRVPPQKMDPVSSSDNLHSYAIEFEAAGRYQTFPIELLNLFA